VRLEGLDKLKNPKIKIGGRFLEFVLRIGELDVCTYARKFIVDR
jgi:hypothetical protein